eukprot:2248532-Amphidinium_carterae.1
MEALPDMLMVLLIVDSRRLADAMPLHLAPYPRLPVPEIRPLVSAYASIHDLWSQVWAPKERDGESATREGLPFPGRDMETTDVVL